ncbi:MAG: hypothetical protein JWP00_3195 [Chloroflexi bacterium]|nr:hypothetical protein [Chloroflexota bacterium]
MYTIDPRKQTEVLRWLMSALDSQWQARTLALYGPVETARLSTRVRSAFGKVEMKALLALVNKERAANLADAVELLETFFTFVWGERGYQGRFLPLDTVSSGMTRLTIHVQRMTALDSLKKAAQAAGEDPALPCEMLWSAWFETLLPDQQIQVTARLSEGYDEFQIDMLDETLLNPPAFPAAFSAIPEVRTPAAALPDDADFENSPIAAALQIPIEQVARAAANGDLAATASLNDPYASGPASYSPPPVTTGAANNSPVPSQNNILSSQQRSGTAEPGAHENLSRRGGTGGLTSRLQQKAESAHPSTPESTGQTPAWNTTPPGPPVLPPQADPQTGRPLYSGDPEEEARSRVLRSKSLPLMSRLFMTKAGRELYERGRDEPLVQLSTIAEKVDLVLQRRMAHAREVYPGQFPDQVRVIGGPDGALQIMVGNQRYQSLDQVPAGPVLDIIKQSVEEWSEHG